MNKQRLTVSVVAVVGGAFALGCGDQTTSLSDPNGLVPAFGHKPGHNPGGGDGGNELPPADVTVTSAPSLGENPLNCFGFRIGTEYAVKCPLGPEPYTPAYTDCPGTRSGSLIRINLIEVYRKKGQLAEVQLRGTDGPAAEGEEVELYTTGRFPLASPITPPDPPSDFTLVVDMVNEPLVTRLGQKDVNCRVSLGSLLYDFNP